MAFFFKKGIDNENRYGILIMYLNIILLGYFALISTKKANLAVYDKGLEIL